METSFWNKLRKSIMTAPKAQPSSAAQQTRFHNCWLTVQKGFSTPEKRSLHVQQTEIPMRLKNMIDLLVDEESRLDEAGATGVCMEYLLKHNVLSKLVNNAEGDEPKGIMGEAIRTIAGMINLLDDRFLVHNAVHKPTVKLLRTCASGMEPQGESYHEDLVDLMYIICSKIHGYPELLNIFFHDKQWLTVPQRVAARRIQKNLETMEMLKSLRASTSEKLEGSDAKVQEQDTSLPDQTSTTVHSNMSADSSPVVESLGTAETQAAPKSDYEFLLFTYLSKFVHREGKGGDFARTGLLFIMELATGSLGDYIMETDFTSFLSAGVGASYSQLPRKLLVRGGPNTINSMVGTLNDRTPPAESTPSRRVDIELSTSIDFQSRLDAFLKLLEFCQDIMMRCPSSNIVNSLLVTFKTVFLENILFPSIMECSDVDGSSVAVISYIDLILQVLEHDALVDLVLGFLLSSEDDENRANDSSQDSDDAFAEMQNTRRTSSYFTATNRFTLKDLILSRLKSRSQPTVIATLKLLNTLITRHCKYSLKLLSIQPDSTATSFRDLPGQADEEAGNLPVVSHHVHELDLFYALISTINPHNTAEIFCNGYDSYLRDAEGAVETHQCFLRSKEIESSGATPEKMSDMERKKQRRRSMKYGQKMDLPDDMPGEAFIREQERNAEAMAALSCCDKSKTHPAPMHRLLPSDPLLQILLGLLSHFFAHSVELNLALTGVITSLAVCPYRSLEGWLLFKSTDIRKPGEEGTFGAELSQAASRVDARFELGDSDDEDTLPSYLTRRNSSKSSKVAADIIAASAVDEIDGASPFKSFPPFFTMLRTLTQQVDYYRSEIDDFDDYLADRRRILLVATELNSVIHTSGLSGTSLPSQFHQKQHQNHQRLRANSFGSDASVAPPGPGTMNMMMGSTPSMPGFMSPRVNSSGPNVPGILPRTSSLPAQQQQQQKQEAVLSGSALSINSQKARKSSSPSSLMSSPSNMPFMDNPGAKHPASLSTGYLSASYSTAHSAAVDSISHQGGNVSDGTSPISIHPSRATPTYPSSVSSYTSSTYSANSPRSAAVGGMASAAGTAAGTQPSSWGSFAAKPGPVPNPVMMRTMETMVIKPLFPDGFINDSDSDVEDENQTPLALSGDEDDYHAEASVVQDGAVEGEEPKQRTRKMRDASTSSSVTPDAPKAQEKTVSLGQLLTNVVILEEMVKEVVAVAQVRRGLGVDKVRFL
ncbi:hypothetical protein EDD11_000548 [Mortierella claussenii]|nr:hypothetical protein EDD11_000548 [Mortierella claussenii]